MKTVLKIILDQTDKDIEYEQNIFLKRYQLAQAINQVDSYIFHPAFKHGYPQAGVYPELDVENWSEDTIKTVERLRAMFFDLITEYELENIVY